MGAITSLGTVGWIVLAIALLSMLSTNARDRWDSRRGRFRTRTAERTTRAGVAVAAVGVIALGGVLAGAISHDAPVARLVFFGTGIIALGAYMVVKGRQGGLWR